MFGRRSDGKKIKSISPLFKLIPHVMSERHDATNLFLLPARCEPLDEFISLKKKEGIHINYMHIVIASIVRLFALKPQLNRFIMNGRIYRRNKIFVSLSVKKSLKEEAEETTIKFEFTGKENIYEVKQIVDEEIKENCGVDIKNDADKTAKLLTSIPNSFMKLVVGFIKWLDKHGMLPKKLIEVSPFHTSCFLTNLKSIHMDFIYHHLYDFGTTGMFVSMGKEKFEPVVDDNNIKVGKVMNLGISADERLCDGFYHASCLKLFKKLVTNPQMLEEQLDDIVHDAKSSRE